MSLLDIRQGIADNLQAHLNELGLSVVNVHVHAGRFDVEELQKISAKAPAVFLACMGLADADDSNHAGITGKTAWAAIVVTKDTPKAMRDEYALSLVNALLLHIPGNEWSLDATTGRPEKINGRNLYSAKTQKFGIALWGVTWQQNFSIGGLGDPATLHTFDIWHADHQLADGHEPAATDHYQYPG